MIKQQGKNPSETRPKTLVILSKPPQDKASSSRSDSPPPSSEMPGFVIKMRDGSKPRSSTPPALSGTKESEIPPSSGSTHKTIHTEANLEQKLQFPPKMPAPVRLIDDTMQWCDTALEYLQELTNYYVVGVVGMQGVGKSTVLNLLCDPSQPNGVFPVQTSDQLGHHCTRGVELYVTADRVILLDIQPVLSPSVMDVFFSGEKKPSDFHSLDNSVYIQSLQLVSFLLSVCHTVLLVQDWFHDPSLLRFLQTAEMLKPTTSAHDSKSSVEETKDYNPQLVFVQNKCTQPDYYPSSVQDMQYLLSLLFHNSKLKHSGLVTMDFMSSREEGEANKVNLFLIPEIEGDSNVLNLNTMQYRGHPGWKQVCKSFYNQVMALPRPNPTSQTFSEKTWLHFAGKSWDTIRKSNLFVEYNRLII